MSAKLDFLSGGLQGREIDVTGGAKIGRAKDRDIRFTGEEKQVSREHATIVVRQDRYGIRDDGSSNGTFVNGRKLPPGETRTLRTSDVITFGHEGPEARFSEVEEPDTAPTASLPFDEEHREPEPVPAAPAPGGGELTRLFQEVVVNRSSDRGRTVAIKDFVGIALKRSRRRTRMIVGGTLAASVLLVVGSVLVMGQREAETRRRAAAQIDSLEQWANLTLGTLEDRVQQLVAEAGEAQSQVVELEEALGEVRRQQQEELDRVRRLVGFSEDIAGRYAPAVGMITNVLRFVDAGGRPVRVSCRRPTSSGCAEEDLDFTLGGSDAMVEFPSGGTGFLVHRDGWALTNRHVVDAAWAAQAYGGEVAEFAQILSAEVGAPVGPAFDEFEIYFPGHAQGIPMSVADVSGGADVALIRLSRPVTGTDPLPLGDPGEAVQQGENIVLMGYPAGAALLLNNLPATDPLTRQAECYEACSVGQRDRLVDELARRGLVQPMVNAGQVNATPPDQFGYAVTGSSTGGSSGGPVVNAEGQVIGVNWGRGVFSDPGFRPQRAALIRFGWALLPADVSASIAGR